jgi:hypothetical protein
MPASASRTRMVTARGRHSIVRMHSKAVTAFRVSRVDSRTTYVKASRTCTRKRICSLRYRRPPIGRSYAYRHQVLLCRNAPFRSAACDDPYRTGPRGVVDPGWYRLPTATRISSPGTAPSAALIAKSRQIGRCWRRRSAPTRSSSRLAPASRRVRGSKRQDGVLRPNRRHRFRHGGDLHGHHLLQYEKPSISRFYRRTHGSSNPAP